MNFGVIRESGRWDRRVALTPPVVRLLTGAGHSVWVERGAGQGAMFGDAEYQGAGAQVGYSPADVLQRADVLVKISTPTISELSLCRPGMAVLAFYHLAVADRAVYAALIDGAITAIGFEIVQDGQGRLPVLAAVSQVAGQMTATIAAHLLRSSSGGPGILLRGSPGVPAAHVVIVGAGVVGANAARAANAAGARLTVLDIDPERLRLATKDISAAATALAGPESVAAAVEDADVVIGAVLVAGHRTPHVITRPMVERMRRGAAIIDVSIDQGGCAETSRPTTIQESTFVYHGVTHFCVPNFTADLGRSASVALAEAMLPYLAAIGANGVSGAIENCADLARGVYTHAGSCVNGALAEAWRA